jgi:hypothetical protein
MSGKPVVKWTHSAAHMKQMRKNRPSHKRKKRAGAAVVGTSTKAARHALNEELLLTSPVLAKPVPQDTSRDIAYRTNVLTPWKIIGKYSCLISAANVATGSGTSDERLPASQQLQGRLHHERPASGV